MAHGKGPKTRRKDHLKSARSALESWRVNTYLSIYSNSALMPDVLLPDKFLTSLASHRVANTQDLTELLPTWAFVAEHGTDVLGVLSRVDRLEFEPRERVKQAKKAKRSQETLARQVESARLKAAEAAANPKPAKRRGRPPKPREPLATMSVTTLTFVTQTNFSCLFLAPNSGPAYSSASNVFNTRVPPYSAQSTYYLPASAVVYSTVSIHPTHSPASAIFLTDGSSTTYIPSSFEYTTNHLEFESHSSAISV